MRQSDIVHLLHKGGSVKIRTLIQGPVDGRNGTEINDHAVACRLPYSENYQNQSPILWSLIPLDSRFAEKAEDMIDSSFIRGKKSIYQISDYDPGQKVRQDHNHLNAAL